MPHTGWVAEWSKAAVLKTAEGANPPQVRILSHPLCFCSSVGARLQLLSNRSRAFDWGGERKEIREACGNHKFGQSCLLARRLVEAGVSFVEVVHRGWDAHAARRRFACCEARPPDGERT